MADELVYVSRLIHLPLIGADGAEIGRLSDVVLGTQVRDDPPPVHGFVVSVQRRPVFVSCNRVAELTVNGARLQRGSINMMKFAVRPSETLVVGALFGRRVDSDRLVDMSIKASPRKVYTWEVATVALGGVGLLARRRAQRIVSWSAVRKVFVDDEPLAREAAAITVLHPAEMAAVIRALPPERRRVLASALQDERLADLLEEMPEEDQIRIVEGLDLERTARVLDEMEADDAADLLGELPRARRDQILMAMDPEEADPVRRLLRYHADTAGGLMTPEPLILSPTTTVAEALARIREPALAPALAGQVFVTNPPFETPTGKYLGLVGYQRLLREVPTSTLASCLDKHPEPVSPDMSGEAVATRAAAYDALSLPVVDSGGRLLGVVTVDDLLNYLLPEE